VNNKTGELILYIASKSQDDPSFGIIKLNKILFAIDFFAYGLWGHSITQATYIRLEQGPAPRDLPDIREELIAGGRAAIQNKKYFGGEQKRLVALTEPDMSDFTQDERGLIDDLIHELKGFNATQLSEWTHSLRPWLAAQEHEEIPYYTVFAMTSTSVSREGLNWGARRLKELREAADVP
jgi:hypothetical protein